MKQSTTHLTLVGGFVLLTIASLVVALSVLAGRNGATDTYYTVYHNVSGLKFGSQVLFEGYPIGQVETIQPIEENGRVGFRVEFSTLEGWKIPEDSVARPAASGVLSPQTIVISTGTSARLLQPGQMVTSGEAMGLMSSISSVSGNIDRLTEEGLVPLVENINHQVTLLGTVIEKDVRPLVQNTNTVLSSGAEHLPVIMAEASHAAKGLSQIMTPERLRSIDRLIANADATMASLRKSSEAVEQLAVKAGPDLTAAIRELRLTTESFSRHSESFSQNMETTSRNLQEFSRQIRQNPSRLVYESGTAESPGKKEKP